MYIAERRTVCLDQVQKLKTADEDDTVSMKSEDMDDDDLPCKATLKISGTSAGNKLWENKGTRVLLYSFQSCYIKNL